MPAHWRAARELRGLPDGEYRAIPGAVPYVPQFASPALIQAYIHEGLHGSADPAWPTFGAPDADTYTFWAQRACAIACVKMAVDAHAAAPPQTLYELVQGGLALGGYRLQDDSGRLTDQGWFYGPLAQLGAQHGLIVTGAAYVSPLTICTWIRAGWLVAAAVTPEIGERAVPGGLRRYDGHFVLVYGFRWQAGRLALVRLHNPSGRYTELQADAAIPAARFGAAFAHRFIAFRPRPAPPPTAR